MRVALVHDWLNTRVGGSEQVLAELARLYPEAPIYTLWFRPEYYEGLIDPSRVRTSSLNKWPHWLTKKPHYLLGLLPTAIESFDFSQYDVVISSSNAFSKGVITRPETLHISYCYSPMRFAWDYWPRYLDEQQIGPLRRLAATHLVSRVRLWDYYSSKRVDHWLTISKTVAARIEKYYGAAAEVIYPPVATEVYGPAKPKDDYYITLATLTPYKQIDQAITVANQTGRRLVVIGDGFDRPRLEKLAGPTVRFAGRVEATEKAKLLAGARALIHPCEEDFGLAPVEAMASGTPVVAYGRGGVAETVTARTGVLYDQPTPAALEAALDHFETKTWDQHVLVARAAEFDTAHFAKTFTRRVAELARDHGITP